MRGLIVAGLILLSACSGGVETASAQAAIARFHAQFNAGQFERIYADSADDMKAASTRQALTGFLTQAQSKLGKHQRSKQVGWRVNYGTKASTQIVLESQFAKGAATETFLITGPNQAPKIAGYHINSDALFTP